MKKSELKKTSLSNAQLKSELIKQFEFGNTEKTNFYELIRTKFKVGKQRCLRMYDVAHKEWAELKDKATSDTVVANTIKGLESGLKSKIEHQLEIQAEILSLQDILKKGFILKKIKISEDETLEKKEIFGSYEIAQINGVIDRKRKELFLLDGMYSASKTEVSGNLEVKQITGMTII